MPGKDRDCIPGKSGKEKTGFFLSYGKSFRLWVMGYGLWGMGYELWFMSWCNMLSGPIKKIFIPLKK
jgi:hypothetical protein